MILLKRAGPYVVALFYALSAYGLVASYTNNHCNLKGFWKKRRIGTILPYLLLYIVTIIIRLLLRESLSIKTILLSFVDGHPLIPYSWFIISIVVFYCVFYLSALLAKKDINLLMVLVSFSAFIYVFAMKKLGFEDFWFNAVWGIPLGLIWQQHHREISASFKKHPWIYLSISGIVALWWVIIAEYFFWFDYFARLCSTLSVSVFVFLLIGKLQIRNPVLRFLGEISLEIYLMHGMLVLVFTHFFTATEQPYLFVGLLLAGSILLAWLFHAGYAHLFRRGKG